MHGRNGATCRAWPDIAPRSLLRALRPSRRRRASASALCHLMLPRKKTGKKRRRAEDRFPDAPAEPLSEGGSSHPQQKNIRLDDLGPPTRTARRCSGAHGPGARQSTSHNTGTVLTLALNYSARSGEVDAFRSGWSTRLRRTAASSTCGSTKKYRRRTSLHAEPARSRSRRAHLGRDAPEQLPAVAAGLR